MDAQRNPRHDAAYKAFPGMSAQEAEDKGFIVVEYVVSGGSQSPVYGYYFDSEIAATAVDPEPPVESEPPAPVAE